MFRTFWSVQHLNSKLNREIWLFLNPMTSDLLNINQIIFCWHNLFVGIYGWWQYTVLVIDTSIWYNLLLSQKCFINSFEIIIFNSLTFWLEWHGEIFRVLQKYTLISFHLFDGNFLSWNCFIFHTNWHNIETIFQVLWHSNVSINEVTQCTKEKQTKNFDYMTCNEKYSN